MKGRIVGLEINGVKYLRAMPRYLNQSIYLGFVLLHSTNNDEKKWKLSSIQWIKGFWPPR
jgi:hypothetical protein